MKRFLLIVSFAFVLFFGYTVNAETISGRATVGRQAVMDTSGNYYYTDYKTLSDNSLNIVPMPTSAGDNFYIMGTEYIYPLALTGQTDFVITVRVPVADNTIYNYQLMDGLNQYDFKVGISNNFSVFNITPDIQVFNHVCGVYTKLGVAHTYCYYDITASFVLDTPTTSAVNLNFAVLNTSGNRSSYYYSGQGTSQVSSVEFPTGYFTSENWDYSVMSPTIRITTGTTTNNQDIIDQSIANTEEIINAIQENYQLLVDSQTVCSHYDKNNILETGKFLSGAGAIATTSGYYGISDFIYIYGKTFSNFVPMANDAGTKYCFYNQSKSLISCQASNTEPVIPSGAYYFRFTSYYGTYGNEGNKPNFDLCQNGNQAIYDFMNESFDGSGIGADITDVQWYENSYFSSLITSPIAFLSSLSESCSPITLTLFNHDVTLPCGTTIFWERDSSYIQNFRTFWNILFAGLIIYRLALQLILTVNDCLDPTKDSVGGFKI